MKISDLLHITSFPVEVRTFLTSSALLWKVYGIAWQLYFSSQRAETMCEKVTKSGSLPFHMSRSQDMVWNFFIWMFSNCSVLIKTNKEVFDALAGIVPVALLLQWDMVSQSMMTQHLENCAFRGYSDLGKPLCTIKGTCNEIPFTDLKGFGQSWIKAWGN